MELPYVNPVGIVEYPGPQQPGTRRLALPLRITAAAILVAFVLVGTATTVASLGRYCLTSQASGPSPAQRR